jgi:D-3-phosphoglycerate dehydrogenase
MTKNITIAVTSDSFSFNSSLVDQLKSHFTDVRVKPNKNKFTTEGLKEFLVDCDGAIIGLENMNKEILETLPKLKIISKYGVGIDNLDLEYMKQKNIALGWTQGLNKTSVSELAVAQMISMSRNLFLSGLNLKNGLWHKDGGRELSELTIGIMGVGHVGKEVIRKLQAFNPKIIAHDILDMSDFYTKYGVEAVTQKDLFTRADIVSLHIPLTSETRSLVNNERIMLMKDKSMLVNTSRGGLVDEEALYHHLKNGKLNAAAMDVFLNEPIVDSKLFTLQNFLPTPHIAGNSNLSVKVMGESAIKHLVNFFSGCET